MQPGCKGHILRKYRLAGCDVSRSINSRQTGMQRRKLLEQGVVNSCMQIETDFFFCFIINEHYKNILYYNNNKNHLN
jgi:hypothetical protein